MEDLIKRSEAIDTLTRLEPSFRGSVLEQALKNMLSAEPEQQMKCGGCRYDNHASGWSEHCVLCRRNYLDFKDRYER